jgi:hypothetical protein
LKAGKKRQKKAKKEQVLKRKVEKFNKKRKSGRIWFKKS